MLCVNCDSPLIAECELCFLCQRPMCFEGVCWEQQMDEDENIFCSTCFAHLEKYMNSYDFKKKFLLD